MKKIKLLLTFLIICTLNLSCDKDPCDDGYTQLDNGVCVPDYIVGIEQNFELGNLFYHSELGAVSYINDIWYDENNIIITTLTAE